MTSAIATETRGLESCPVIVMLSDITDMCHAPITCPDCMWNMLEPAIFVPDVSSVDAGFNRTANRDRTTNRDRTANRDRTTNRDKTTRHDQTANHYQSGQSGQSGLTDLNGEAL